MTEWVLEECIEEPQELMLVSPDTYIQRKDIRPQPAIQQEDGTEIPAHWVCLSRFIPVAEYNQLAEIEKFRAEQVIDRYTLQLIKEGIV